MTLKDFQAILINSLTPQKKIIHILKSDSSILVSCNDDSNFYVNIIESKRTFIRDGNDEGFIIEYFATHTEEEFAQDVANMTKIHPGFFYYFMVFTKLKDMNIIDEGLFDHIMDCIVYQQNEFDEFMIEILNHYQIGK